MGVIASEVVEKDRDFVLLFHLQVSTAVSCTTIFTSDVIMDPNLCTISELPADLIFLDSLLTEGFAADIAVFCMIEIVFIFFCHDQAFGIEKVFKAFGFNFD